MFDLEANGLLDTADKLWIGVFKDIETKEVFKFHVNQGEDYVDNMLAFMDSCKTLIAHNGIGYDFPLLRKLFNYEYKGNKVDTLIMSRMLFPTRIAPRGCKAGPHSVESYGMQFRLLKPEHEDWSQYSEEMNTRCSKDVEIQVKIYNYLMKAATMKPGVTWWEAFKTNFKVFEILQRQAEYGWKLDKEYTEAKIRMTTKWIERIDNVLDRHLPLICEIEHSKSRGVVSYYKAPFTRAGKLQHYIQSWVDELEGVDALTNNNDSISGPFTKVKFRKVDPSSRDEVVKFLLDSGWEPKEFNYNDEGEVTSPKLSKDETFEGVEGKTGKLLAKRIQIRHRRSVMEGWLRNVRPDGRISAVVTGIADTGRMKHSGIVNVPNADAFFGKQMRKCFIASEGKTLVGCDATSCQDRMLANRARVEEFKDMLLNGDKDKGTDGHSLARKAVNYVHNKLGIPLISRQKAKNYNFAFKFGASDNKLGRMSNKGKEVGEKIRASLRKVFHAQAALVDDLTNQWERTAHRTVNKWGGKSLSNGYIRGLDGRPICIQSPHAILVYMLQSDEAITMCKAYCLMYDRLNEAGHKWGDDYGIVCFYHDEVTVECRKEIAQDVARIMEGCISDAGKHFKLDFCPQEGKAEIGENWFAIH